MILIKHRGGGGMNTSWEKRREPKCCRSRNWKADQNEWNIEKGWCRVLKVNFNKTHTFLGGEGPSVVAVWAHVGHRSEGVF